MASTGAIFTSTYHTKQLNPWPSTPASRVVNYSRLSACQGDVAIWRPPEHSWTSDTEASETSYSKNSPGNFQHRYLPELLVNAGVQLSFNGELKASDWKCVLMLCAWKVAFLKSGHICHYSIIFPISNIFKDHQHFKFSWILWALLIKSVTHMTWLRASPIASGNIWSEVYVWYI